VARQAQFWREQLGLDVNLTVEQVALTRQQAASYHLPRTPIKETDLRAAGFEARHGEGAVELDALEALYPGTLDQIVRDAAEPYIDQGLARRLDRARRDTAEAARLTWEEATEQVHDDLDALNGEVGPILDGHRVRLEQVAADLADDLESYRPRLEALREELDRIARTTIFDVEERPQPDEPDVDRDELLYDSGRHWLAQLEAFKRRQAGEEV
jgi:hypothetical protein